MTPLPTSDSETLSTGRETSRKLSPVSGRRSPSIHSPSRPTTAWARLSSLSNGSTKRKRASKRPSRFAGITPNLISTSATSTSRRAGPPKPVRVTAPFSLSGREGTSSVRGHRPPSRASGRTENKWCRSGESNPDWVAPTAP